MYLIWAVAEQGDRIGSEALDEKREANYIPYDFDLSC